MYELYLFSSLLISTAKELPAKLHQVQAEAARIDSVDHCLDTYGITDLKTCFEMDRQLLKQNGWTDVDISTTGLFRWTANVKIYKNKEK